MLAHRYKVWSWGPEIFLGSPDVIKQYAGITVIAKRHRFTPYEVFNELVSFQLGRAMGLPVPIGMVVENSSQPFYCSGDIGLAVDEFPPADLAEFAKNEPDLACGTAIFDGWICNKDRHGKNIFYDSTDHSVYLIDHGESLLNCTGPSHMNQRKNELPLRKEFADELENFDSFADWYKRLVSIPSEMILATVTQAASVGVPAAEASALFKILIERRRDLPNLFEQNKALFPKLKPSLFPPFVCDDDPTEYCI